MKFSTAITHFDENDREVIHGKDLQEWVKNGKSFSETIFFLLRGTEATEQERIMMDAMLSIAIDHGPGTASGMTSRIVASAKNSMHTSVAAGLLAMGERHGSAIEPAMHFFYEYVGTDDVSSLVGGLKEQKIRIPGYGHPFLEVDERGITLFEIAKQQGIFGKHCACALQVKEALNAVSSKALPLNIDGAMASILCDMGFDARMAKGIFMIARVPGLVAQVYEETVNDEGIKRLGEDDIEYLKA